MADSDQPPSSQGIAGQPSNPSSAAMSEMTQEKREKLDQWMREKAGPSEGAGAAVVAKPGPQREPDHVSPDDPKACQQCNRVFANKLQRLDHVFRVHRPMPRCPVKSCSKLCSVPSDVQKHFNKTHRPLVMTSHAKCDNEDKVFGHFCVTNGKGMSADHKSLADLN